MPWTKKRDPLAPVPPAYHHPERCLHCGHIGSEHNDEVGCLVEGGTKYLEHDDGTVLRACSCEQYVPAPAEEAVA